MNRAYALLHVKAIDADRRVLSGIATTPEVVNGTADFEKTLFELLVAASYTAAGWKPELLRATGRGKPPDIRATVAGADVFIECKRMSKNSGYYEAERERWYVLVKPLVEFIERNRIPGRERDVPRGVRVRRELANTML